MVRFFVGMETSGMTRRELASRGDAVVSCDLLPCVDNPSGNQAHWRGDVFEVLDQLWAMGWWPDAAVFHPDCTYHTGSAEWAYGDPDFTRYPGVGYHQKIKPGTLTGKARRDARETATLDVFRIRALKIRRIVIENPVGQLSGRIGKPTQIVQPYEFGDNASKKTCLWVYEGGELLPRQEWLPIDPRLRVPGRIVNGVERWANQTDSGQNRLSPSADRWAARSDTYPGIARAIANKLREG